MAPPLGTPPEARDRLPRPERRGQDHHHAGDPGPGRAHLRPDPGRRPPVRHADPAAARGRVLARRDRPARRPDRLGAPALRRAEQRDRAAPGHRGARAGRARGGRAAPGQGLLARHEAAPGHRGRAARRPPGTHVRRAGQRPGPGGYPLDPRVLQGTGQAGPHRPGLQPPDERDGADRRPPGRHRPRQAARRPAHGSADRVERPPGRAAALAPGGRARPAAHRQRRDGHAAGRRRAGRHRPGRRRRRRPGRRARHRPARPGAQAGLTGGRLPRPHRREHRLPRAAARHGKPLLMSPSLAIRALDLLVSEWTKFRSVRSTYWSLLVAVVTTVAVSTLVAFAFANQPASAGPPPDPLLAEVISLEYAVIAVAVMGVLAFSAEYSTGLIRTTFTAAPRRRAVLAAKAVVLAAVTLAAGELVAFVSFFLVQAVLSGHHQGVSLSRPGVPGAVLAAGLLLCVCALLGLALGSVIRHTAGGIAATIAVIVVPSVLGLLPAPWNGRIGRFTLLETARQVTALHPAANLFSPGLSLLVVLAWPAAALVRSEEHTSELQSRFDLVCRLLLEKKKKNKNKTSIREKKKT